MADETTTETETTNSQTATTTEQTSAETTDASNSSTMAAETSTADDDNVDLSKAADDKDDVDNIEGTDTDTDTDKGGDVDDNFGAPEEGAAYEITGLPEGMEIDKAALDAITPIARELNLSNAGLSKIAQVYAEKVLPSVGQASLDDLQNQITEQRTAWETEARAAVAGKDAEGKDIVLKNVKGETLAFDGKPMKDVQRVAAKALDRFAPEGFRQFLEDTGLGVHPQMIAFAYQAGKRISEETNFEASGGGDANREKSRAEKFYG